MSQQSPPDRIPPGEFLKRVYGWMALGAALTLGLAALLLFQFPGLVFAWLRSQVPWYVAVSLLTLMAVLRRQAAALGYAVAVVLYVALAGVSGVALALAAAALPKVPTLHVLGTAAVLFAALATFGHATKLDLRSAKTWLDTAHAVALVVLGTGSLAMDWGPFGWAVTAVGLLAVLALVAEGAQSLQDEAQVTEAADAPRRAVLHAALMYIELVQLVESLVVLWVRARRRRPRPR